MYKSNRSRAHHGTRKPKGEVDLRTTKQILLDIEQFLADAFGHIHELLHSVNRKENVQMADFEKIKARLASLNSKVAGLTNREEAFKAALAGMRSERDAAIAERDRLKAADDADQSEVDSAEAALADIESTLATLEAIDEGTGDSGGGGSEEPAPEPDPEPAPGSQGGGSNES